LLLDVVPMGPGVPLLLLLEALPDDEEASAPASSPSPSKVLRSAPHAMAAAATKDPTRARRESLRTMVFDLCRAGQPSSLASKVQVPDLREACARRRFLVSSDRLRLGVDSARRDLFGVAIVAALIALALAFGAQRGRRTLAVVAHASDVTALGGA